MSTKFKYSNRRPINGDYFKIIKEKTDKHDLDFYINRINFDDYYIFKASDRQRLVSVDEFMDFKYSNYIFFKKELYDLDLILEWTDCDYMIHYLCKPVPPFPPSKIIYKHV